MGLLRDYIHYFKILASGIIENGMFSGAGIVVVVIFFAIIGFTISVAVLVKLIYELFKKIGVF